MFLARSMRHFQIYFFVLGTSLLPPNGKSYGQVVVFKGNINKTEKDTRFIYGVENRGMILLNLNKAEIDALSERPFFAANLFYLIDSTNNVIQVYDIGPNSSQRYRVFHMEAKGDFFYVYTCYTVSKTLPNSDRITLTNLQYLKFARDGSLRPVFTNLTGTNPYDDYLVTHSKNDTTYIIGVNKTKFTVSVNVLTPTQQVFRKEFAFNEKKLFRQFYREDYFPVKDLPENSFETFLHPNKFYIGVNELIFVSDDDGGPVTNVPGNPTASLNRNVTFIIRLNLLTGKATVQELRHNYTVKADHNSFLYKNHLFALRFTNDEYSISVVELSSLKEIRKYTQSEIKNLVDWSKFIITDNTKLTPERLTGEFQTQIRSSLPVIGIHYQNGGQIFFGLMGKESKGQRVGDIKINSLGYLEITFLSANLDPLNRNPGMGFESRSATEKIDFPIYYVPPEIRTVSRRIYTKIPIDLATLTLSNSIRPVSLYDEFEQVRIKQTNKKHDNAVFSFENNESVFLTYFTTEEESEDVFVVIEKYPRK